MRGYQRLANKTGQVNACVATAIALKGRKALLNQCALQGFFIRGLVIRGCALLHLKLDFAKCLITPIFKKTLFKQLGLA